MRCSVDDHTHCSSAVSLQIVVTDITLISRPVTSPTAQTLFSISTSTLTHRVLLCSDLFKPAALNLFPCSFYCSVFRPTSAIDIHADPEVMMQNGTTGVLRCTFKSSEVVSSSTSVTWSFQSSQPDNQFSKAPYVVSPQSSCAYNDNLL